MKVKKKIVIATLALTFGLGLTACSSSELGKDPYHPIPLEEYEGGNTTTPSKTTTKPVTPTGTGETPTSTGGGDTPTPTESTKTPTPTETSEVTGDVSAVSDVKVDSLGKLSWKKATNALYYDVEINGDTKQTKFNNFDLLSIDALPSNGVFKIKVRGTNSTSSGAWSSEVTYNYVGSKMVAPSVAGVIGTVLSFSSNATEFKGISKAHPVMVVGSKETDLASDAETFDLASVTTKTEIAIYLKGDGVYNKDSDKVKLVYNPTASNKLAFTKPTNVHMDGDLLKFDEVSGANIYYLKDVYNTVTSISGEEINSLSSNREGHFLIKEIWAGNTDLDIADSDHVEVTYFTSEEGLGTLDNPFLISTPAHLRYIEYYEALGEAKHYKLTNDIELKDYTPADDEDYSNFYNLGSLSGEIDGDGHSIKNIVVYYKDGYSSIFDTINATGVIKNLKIENTRFRTWTNRTNDGIMHEKGGEAAILAYTNKGIIDNVTLISGSVVAVKDGAAGLVSINRGKISNSKVLADFVISGEKEAGSFAIYNAGTIEGCINYASISGSLNIGGIAGRNAGTISKCGNEGKITADTNGGGITGYNYNIRAIDHMQFDTLISMCYNKGEVIANSYAGGIAGKNGSDGYNETGKDSFGNAGIYASYNQGAVKGMTYVGGIAGANYAYYEGVKDSGFGLVGCYNAGAVSMLGDLKENRVYLNLDNCTWAESDSPDFLAYAWKSENGQDTPILGNWPGTKMTKTTIQDKTYYYVDVNPKLVSGIIFNRVNPSNHGEIFNQTADIKYNINSSTAIYYINSDFESGAALVEPLKGSIAGLNNIITDSYTLSSPAEGGKINTTVVSVNTDAVKSEAELKAIATTLNAKLKAICNLEPFEAKDGKYPILAWEEEANS